MNGRIWTFNWFDALQASRIGASLADVLAPKAKPESADSKDAGIRVSSGALQEVLRRADREVRPLRLNVYKKAKFASSFKLRLLEIGVSIEVAAEVTQTLILHLAMNNAAPVPRGKSPVEHADPPSTAFARDFRTQANEHFNNGSYA